tara:strand:+ start:11240 stop:12178 length:939 start_codon:yes stop_codon:yes gene_type:complete
MLIAGFDAGQTSTRCRISQWDGTSWKICGEGSGPGVSHLAATGGRERFLHAVRCSAANALGTSASCELDAAVVGASGIEQGTRLQASACQLLAETLQLPLARVNVTGDEYTALRGAFPDDEGIVMISGTGMICLGRNVQGQEHRCGGWGWRLDGAGSTFDLGHQGLQLSMAMADGRLPDHQLRQDLWKQLSCATAEQVKAQVVQPECDSARIAALAPIVVEYAAAGYAEAEAIVTRSATALASCAGTVARALAMDHPRLVGHGGGLTHLHHFRQAVERAVQKDIGAMRWVRASGDACQGALSIALDLSLKQR